MTNHNTQSDYSACIPCGIDKPSRNTYFNGKLLVERDFRDEQIYHIAKQRLLNSLLHGQGTVCGLRVRAHPSEDCRDRYVYVEAGLALDCCGREIVVPEKAVADNLTVIPVADLVEQEELVLDGTQDLFIAICYQEQTAELVPVILPECDCADQQQAPNRIEECFEFKVFVQTQGDREQERPPLQAKLDWRHTITLSEQSPRALAIDDEFQQVYLATLAPAEDEDASDGARIYAYRQDNQDLITALNAGSNPVDLAVSDSGELIYLAGEGLGADLEEGPVTGIAIYRESGMRGNVNPVAYIDLDERARLAISPRSGALFALLLQSGQLIAWSEEAINDWLPPGPEDPPPPIAGPAVSHSIDLGSDFSAEDGVALRGGSVLDISLDGRFLFILDPNAETEQAVRVINIARLFANEPDALITPTLPDVEAEETPIAVRVSRDSEFIFLLTRIEQDEEQFGRLRRFQWDTTQQEFHGGGRGGRWPGTPWDLALAPREKWAYVSQTRSEGDGEQSEVEVISIDEIISVQGQESLNAVSAEVDLSGLVRFARLTVLGHSLYVASDDQSEEEQPQRGLVAVLDIQEADCAELFFDALDGCPACPGDQHQCVVLAHLPGYQPGARIQEPGQAAEGDVAIDNRTYRPLVPSTTNITDVIQCMLQEGFAEGIPGPRGTAGPSGERGPGITEVGVTTRMPGTGATANLSAIADDEEGDQRLELGVPAGLQGDPGAPGVGITDVAVTTLESDQLATAELVPIPQDPQGNQRLELGIPRGESGVIVEPELTHIVALSWVHGQDSFDGLDAFRQALANPGIVVGFDGPVFTQSVIFNDGRGQPGSLVFELLQRQERSACWCPAPALICQPVVEFRVDNATRRITDVQVPAAGEPLPETARGFRLALPENADIAFTEFLYRVVFRSDFALDEANRRGVDGNHIGGLVPSQPSGNGNEGGTFESWFQIAR